jgi:hypothetical protein
MQGCFGPTRRHALTDVTLLLCRASSEPCETATTGMAVTSTAHIDSCRDCDRIGLCDAAVEG